MANLVDKPLDELTDEDFCTILKRMVSKSFRPENGFKSKEAKLELVNHLYDVFYDSASYYYDSTRELCSSVYRLLKDVEYYTCKNEQQARQQLAEEIGLDGDVAMSFNDMVEYANERGYEVVQFMGGFWIYDNDWKFN